ncbi:hypothetical protein EYC80_006558 [Monilinia laxa]|uniref:Uncharacterized protein n=1 Tax=Monilinia laxa TaxID=61186 RepID=A0A5N6JSB1_MONLA|nr:hypothetical protein EYC80_006558 [Monilinia laxa]
MPVSSRGDSQWADHTRASYSTPLTSTSPDILEPSTERRSVSFKEPSQIPKYDPHSGRYADLESDYGRHWTNCYSRDKKSSSVRDYTSWTEASMQDTTIQLEFNFSEDIESYLEELSRLRRIGRYNDARQYYNTCRTYCGDHPELVIDYVDTLLAQGAFKDVLNLATDKNNPILSQECDKIYHHYLHSSLCVARATTLGWLEEAVWEWTKARAEMLSEFERDFTKLSPLQKDVIGDNSGYLRTCLAKYLFIMEQEEQKNLSNELKEFDREETNAGQSSNPTLKWYQRKIQRALCSSLSLSEEQQDLFSWMEKSAYHELPRDFSNRYKLLHSKSRNDSYYWCEGSIAAYTRDDRASKPYIPGNPFAPNPSSGLSFFPDREDFIEYSSYIRPFMPQPYNIRPNQTEPIRRNYSPHREHRPLNIRSRESIPPEPPITREELVKLKKPNSWLRRQRSVIDYWLERQTVIISSVDDQ